MLKDDIIKVLEKDLKINSNTILRLNQFLECIDGDGVQDILTWLQKIKESLNANVSVVNLNDVGDSWEFDKDTGNLQHKTGGFFKIVGIETETEVRESGVGWAQPMIDQGTESSIVGLLKKNIGGIPKYLIEAKFEPGNYDRVLLSPTIQVTYDNLNKLHGGRTPLFSEYFVKNKNKNYVMFEHWYPEDGGRFYKKRVKNMLVETEDELVVPDNFKWLSMYQIKELLKMDNLVNPHLRSIISYL